MKPIIHTANLWHQILPIENMTTGTCTMNAIILPETHQKSSLKCGHNFLANKTVLFRLLEGDVCRVLLLPHGQPI